MGDALAHSIVPGVALAYALSLPYSIGAFVAGLLAAWGMNFVQRQSKLREDTIIGLVFTSFFALGLVIVSINPTSVNLQAIVLGNILSISPEDQFQVLLISLLCLLVLGLKWKDLMHVFFDEKHARSVGLPVKGLRILFFTLLSASTVAALQTVGACLVIAMVITPGATAYLLTDRFPKLITIACLLGAFTAFSGAYLSYFADVSPGGLIVTLQTVLFFLVFFFAPKHGYWQKKRSLRKPRPKLKELKV